MLNTQTLLERLGIEKTIMILISRIYFGNAEKNDVQDFLSNHEPNWQLLLEIIRSHSIRPFIFHIAISRKLELPEEFMNELKKEVGMLSIRNLHQRQLLASITEEMAEAGIFPIPYKGLNFAKFYYGSYALRESNDIDLLFSKKDVKSAIQFMKSKQLDFPVEENLPDDWLPFYLMTGKDVSFIKKKDLIYTDCLIEVQWRLTERHVGRYPDYEFFALGIEKESKQDPCAYTRLNPSYEFLAMVSHHFLREQLMRFKYVIDTACLFYTSDNQLDTALIDGVISKYGCKNVLNQSLSVVDDLVGIRPKAVRSTHINDSPLLSYATAYPVYNKSYPSAHYHTFLNIQDNFINKIKARLRLIHYYLTPSIRDIIFVKIPVWLFPLILIIRPVRLIYNYLNKRKN